MWDLGSAALFYPPFSASAEFAGFGVEKNVSGVRIRFSLLRRRTAAIRRHGRVAEIARANFCKFGICWV
jgi:hypothetical protein